MLMGIGKVIYCDCRSNDWRAYDRNTYVQRADNNNSNYNSSMLLLFAPKHATLSPSHTLRAYALYCYMAHISPMSLWEINNDIRQRATKLFRIQWTDQQRWLSSSDFRLTCFNPLFHYSRVNALPICINFWFSLWFADLIVDSANKFYSH